MYGKISIYITSFIALVLPSIFITLHWLKGIRAIEKVIIIIQKLMILPVFSIPFLSLAIIIFGILSKINNEPYGISLNICIGFGVLMVALFIILIVMFMNADFGGIR